jgi:31-O-methyltransferase
VFLELVDLANGLEVWVEDRSEAVFLYEEIFRSQVYLPDRRKLDRGCTIFDVGANIGLASIFFSQLYPTSTILAFEPAPTSFEILEANFGLHHIKGHTERCALSDRAGHATFTYYPHAPAKSGLYPDRSADQATSKEFLRNEGLSDVDIDWLLRRKFVTEIIPVPCRTLSEVITTAGVPRVDLLKIDVEKSELDVLLGVTHEHWQAGTIRQIVMEVEDVGSRLSRLTDLLERHRYHVRVSSSPVGHDPGACILVAHLG